MTKRYWWVILTYIIMQFSSLGVGLLLKHFTSMDSETLGSVLIYWNIFSFIAALIVTLLLMRPDMKNLDRSDRPHAGIIILVIIGGVFMAFASQFIAIALEWALFDITPGSENTSEITNITRIYPLFIVIPALIAPILEEIIFRKIIFGRLYKRTNFFIAALLSALIFGIIHQEPEHILIYASMGFVFAFLYVMTKRIIVPIIVHMAMNSISVIGQLTTDPEELEKMREQLDQLNTILTGG